MSFPDSDNIPENPFQSWFWIISNLIFSSIFLLFVFWTLTTYLLLDNLRIGSASTAHILLIFDTPPTGPEVQGLKATIEKIAGEGSVSSLTAPDLKSRVGRNNSQRILSVAVSMGRTPTGEMVGLSAQIRSIQEIVKNDTAIKEIVFNRAWVARVHLLARISRGIKKGLEVLGGFVFLGFGLYWARVSPFLWSHLFPTPSLSAPRESSGMRSPLFQRESEGQDLPGPGPAEREGGHSSAILHILSAGVWGGLSASVSVFLAWSLRAFLYPGPENPFMAGAMGPLPLLHPLWIFFPALSAGVGIVGGILSLLLPFPARKRDLFRP
ncbi:MAG: hypothetical protein M0T83_08200 [Nitrospiraceae bacterium]|nr:hypothetical protein [Nitrospiraceae bacterium]